MKKINIKNITATVSFSCIFLLQIHTLIFAAELDNESLINSLSNLVKRSEMLAKKAKGFDLNKVMAKLAPNKINNFYYRFDDHLSKAVCDRSIFYSLDKPKITQRNYEFEFEGKDALEFKTCKGKHIINNGVLIFNYSTDDYLENLGNLSMQGELGEIEIRMRCKKSKCMAVGWSDKNASENKRKQFICDDTGMAVAYFNVIPDNEFHVYKIDATNYHLKSKESTVAKIFFRPIDVLTDEFVIDYIHLVTAQEKFTRQLYGQVYFQRNGQDLREALYMASPACLKYSINIPNEKVMLSFGASILQKGTPVTFNIFASSEGVRKLMYSQKIFHADKWEDVEIDFYEWAGKEVAIEFIAQSQKNNIIFLSNPIIFSKPKERFNVIIILEDSERADHLSCYGYPKRTTPIKDKFIKNGILFLNAFSQANITMVSCPSIMTALYPLATGIGDDAKLIGLHNNYLTLAEIMRSQGFVTASFIQNSYAGLINGLHQGFSYLYESEDSDFTHGPGTLYCKKLYNWIEKNKNRNFCLYLHILDPHHPYGVSNSSEILPKKSTTELYDGEIKYNDYYFGRFLQRLRKLNILDDTLIIFMADHGEHLGEHGLEYHISPTYLQVIHVPLLMVFPKKLPKNLKIIQPVQLIDIMPTILDLASIKTDELILQGDSLIPLINGKNISMWDNRVCVSMDKFDIFRSKSGLTQLGMSIFYKNWHIIASPFFNDGGDNYRVFDYFIDKRESTPLKNIFFTEPLIENNIKSLMQQLRTNNIAIWQELTSKERQASVYDEETINHLRALGYLQ